MAPSVIGISAALPVRLSVIVRVSLLIVVLLPASSPIAGTPVVVATMPAASAGGTPDRGNGADTRRRPGDGSRWSSARWSRCGSRATLALGTPPSPTAPPPHTRLAGDTGRSMVGQRGAAQTPEQSPGPMQILW